MKISVIGSGAMGSLFGGKLSLTGHEVILYDISVEHIHAIKKSGLEIEDLSTGKKINCKPETTTNPEEAADADALIIFVKSGSTRDVCSRFKDLVNKETLIASLQNGTGNDALISSAFGTVNTAIGVTSQGATLTCPGKIIHAGKGPTYISMVEGNNSRLSSFAEPLNKAGFETRIVDDIQNLIWNKLIINVGINALTALTGLENGKLLDSDDLKSIMKDLVTETMEVARAKGIKISFGNPVEAIYKICRKTAYNRSSMLQDFDRGTRTEIDFINGAIVREGEKFGIPVPVNRTVTRLVKGME